jgi:hypothetical protein
MEATEGVKDKAGAVMRCALGLIDANHDGAITRDELKIYAAKASESFHM